MPAGTSKTLTKKKAPPAKAKASSGSKTIEVSLPPHVLDLIDKEIDAHRLENGKLLKRADVIKEALLAQLDRGRQLDSALSQLTTVIDILKQQSMGDNALNFLFRALTEGEIAKVELEASQAQVEHLERNNELIAGLLEENADLRNQLAAKNALLGIKQSA
ncbi:hypothetical protein HFN60_30110 [Rhizobium leguminosarum]|uniref:hypothetical protein n=1 Tax=Rhizobium leguminosarum TaxID=384 RepID=UPI001C93D4F3|nr:hypothetical protein [Rhizobium leguminosarum]MBY5819849.1 hypothetical protein [Rhizobium leguminosarum]